MIKVKKTMVLAGSGKEIELPYTGQDKLYELEVRVRGLNNEGIPDNTYHMSTFKLHVSQSQLSCSSIPKPTLKEVKNSVQEQILDLLLELGVKFEE